MIPELKADNKWLMRIGFAVLFLGVILFSYTQSFKTILVPVAFIYLLLLYVNWKVAYYLFLFTIPISIDYQLTGSLSTSLPDEPLMWIFMFMFPAIFLQDPKVLGRRTWFRDPIVTVVILQFAWMIVAVIFSHEHLLSFKFMAAKIWFLISFFILPYYVFRDKKDFRRAFLLFLVPLVATMVVIMLRHAARGFHFRKVEYAIGDLYYNHVDYSAVISIFFPLLLVAWPMTRKMRNPLVKAAILFLIMFFLPAIYLTYARAAVLAVIFAIVVAIAIRIRLVNLIFPVFYGLLAMLIIYMADDNRFINFRPNYEKTYMHKNFAEHVMATFRGEDMSSMERLYRWIAAMRMSTDEPVKGWGPNAFYYYYKPYAVSSFKTYVSRNTEQSTTHNYFLYMLVEQGWPAMILYAVLIMVALAQAQKTYHRFKDRYYKNCTLGAAMMFGAAFVNNFFSELLETHKVGSLFYISLALLVALRRISLEQEKKEQEGIAEVTPQ
ncbi:MAG: O-antigen ligase family protein [Chitinophagales bacterium]|nr:O-antigen ligase family protein [Chitinophagales bacterium]